MLTTLSHEGWWLRRHKLQALNLQAQNKKPLDARTSSRFAREFEAAVRARGLQAKDEANAAR